MKEFLLTYYKELVILAWFIIEFTFSLILLIKKNRVRDIGTLSQVLDRLPALIKEAEDRVGSGNGFIKKESVLTACLKAYKDLTGTEVNRESWIAEYFSKAIEDILSTPTKK